MCFNINPTSYPWDQKPNTHVYIYHLKLYALSYNVSRKVVDERIQQIKKKI